MNGRTWVRVRPFARPARLLPHWLRRRTVDRRTTPARRAVLGAEELLGRRGAFAVVVTRPLPILGDTVAILSGASRMSWRTGAVAATIGSLPEAVAYAVAGALAASSADGAVVWSAFVVVASAFWLAAGHAARVEQRALGASD